MQFNIFLEQRLLWHEIGLRIKEVAIAATGLSLRTLAAALSREASIRPEATLTDNVLHSLEPPWIMGVVIWKVKWLLLTGQWIDAIVHVWPIWVAHPQVLGISTLIRQKRFKNKIKSALWTILVADMASSACFRWLGALLNMKRPWARPFVLPLKMLITQSTWAMSSVTSKNPSQFLPGLNTIHASLQSDQ